jgi:hypothetical protein
MLNICPKFSRGFFMAPMISLGARREQNSTATPHTNSTNADECDRDVFALAAPTHS